MAARRELAEEIGLTGYRLLPAGTACVIWDGPIDRVHFFELRLEQLPELRLDENQVARECRMPSNLQRAWLRRRGRWVTGATARPRLAASPPATNARRLSPRRIFYSAGSPRQWAGTNLAFA
jgi:8-oxo-dGTP pyrophosphatase MutT (NUDIX family)